MIGETLRSTNSRAVWRAKRSSSFSKESASRKSTPANPGILSPRDEMPIVHPPHGCVTAASWRGEARLTEKSGSAYSRDQRSCAHSSAKQIAKLFDSGRSPSDDLRLGLRASWKRHVCEEGPRLEGCNRYEIHVAESPHPGLV